VRPVAIVLALLCGTAHAEPKGVSDNSVAIVIFTEGQRKYEASEYDAAAALFDRAYTTFPDPAYLYNAAQAYRLGKRCTQARDAYRKFVELARPARTSTRARVRARSRGVRDGGATCAETHGNATTGRFFAARRDGRCRSHEADRGDRDDQRRRARARGWCVVHTSRRHAPERSRRVVPARRDVCVDEGEDRPTRRDRSRGQA